VNYFGNIYEGNFTPNFKMNGFCVSFIGNANEIRIGWYKDNISHGNCMIINAQDLSLKESGWYEEGMRVGEMKNHKIYKKFQIK